MATSTPYLVSRVSQEGLKSFQKQCFGMTDSSWNIREQLRAVDLSYMREMDQTNEHQKAKQANKSGNSNRYQNITIPVVLPTVEAAVVYQASVFLSGNPIFGVVANPAYQDAAMQLEAIMDNHATRGGWIRHLQMFFRDGFKYNLSAIEAVWDTQTSYSLEHDSAFNAGKTAKQTELIWEGNTIKRLDPYNLVFDARVPLVDIPRKGEFAGYTEFMSRVALKQYIAGLPNKQVDNIKAAFESGISGGGTSSNSSYYVPSLNPNASIDFNPHGGTDWMAWQSGIKSADSIQYKNGYEVSTLYGRIIPSDFQMRVPAPNTPQVWKFVYVNGEHLLYAERQTNAHNMLPIIFGQPLEDGLSYQTKSLADNVSGIQELSSAMMNSVIAARRRAISDRGLYDPSRVSEANINSDNPSAKIPVRPAAYGKPLSESYYPIPFRDDQSATIMQEMGTVIKMAEMISGQNPARQGQFVKGNKTQTEYSDVMNNSNGRDQNVSILLEAQVFTSLKEILKTNIVQFQGPASIYYREKNTEVKIDPVVLRKAVLEFKVSDGLSPTSKLINADAFQTALQVIGSSPQIGANYNMGPMFSYLMKTQGALIGDFEKSNEQVAYETANSQWMQMAQLAIEKGQPWNNPQPMPEQFGYLQEGKLGQVKPAPPDALATMIQTISAKAVPAESPDIGTAIPS
jgi:hypothetical protein